MPKTSCADSSALRELPARTIASAIAAAAERWTDADFPPRVRASAAIVERLGYSLPVVDYALDRLFGGITPDAIAAAIAGELGSLEILDGFVERAGAPAAWARGAGAVTIISSDTTIGVAIVPLIFALCAKCAVTVKDRADALVAAFAETLGEERAELAAATDVRAWSGGDDDVEAQTLGAARVVVAFGGNDALRAIRGRCAGDATFVPFGHRASAGYVSAAALAGDIGGDRRRHRARRPVVRRRRLPLAARAIRRARRVRRERTLRRRAGRGVRFQRDRVSERSAQTGARGPRRGVYERGRISRRQRQRARAARARRGVVDRYRPACRRTAAVRRRRDPRHLRRPRRRCGCVRRFTRTAAAGAGRRVADDARALAVALGTVRVTPFGCMQDPPLAGHHGGRPRIGDFIRWIDRA